MVSAWLRRNIVIVVLAAIAAGIAIWVFTRPAARPPGMHEVPIARARLARCLLGEPVARTGPDISRLRAIQLAGAADWPERCAPYAAALEHAIPHDDDRPDDEGSRALAAGRLFESYAIENAVGALLTPGPNEPIVSPTEVARAVPPPPAPTLLPHEVAAVASSAWRLDDLGDPGLALVLGDQVACRFAAHDGGLDRVAHCSYPPDALAYAWNRWSPVRTTTAADLLVVANGAIRSFATGERVVETKTARQAWNVAGTLFVWPADATRTSVLRRSPTGATTILRLPHALDTSATLVRDQLLWTEHERVVGVALVGAKVGAVYEVAKAARLPRPVTCATNEIAAALVTSGEAEYRIAVLANGTWRLAPPGPRYDLQCSGGTVTGLTANARSSGIAIARIDCDVAGCTPSHATLDDIAGPYAVAALGKATIVVWVDDLVRGVRGSLAGLARAKRFAIYDGARAERLDSKQTSMTELIHHIDVVGRGRSAIVVLQGDGIQLVDVRDGKPERVNVVFD